MIIIKTVTIGIGGAGVNIIRYLVENEMIQNDYYVFDTNLCQLKLSIANESNRLLLGESITLGLGSGGNPQYGEEAMLDSYEDVKKIILNYDCIIIIGGMGSGTATGGIPIISKLAKELNKKIYHLLIMSFNFEGDKRYTNAINGINKTIPFSDSLISIYIESNLGIESVMPKIKLYDLLASSIYKEMFNIVKMNKMIVFPINQIINNVLRNINEEEMERLKELFNTITINVHDDKNRIVINCKEL